MAYLSQKELDSYSNKILEDYDCKNPSAVFKDKIDLTNEDALLIQSNVARLREKRGEQIIGYKIGCISKDTQKKMGLIQPAFIKPLTEDHQNPKKVLMKYNLT